MDTHYHVSSYALQMIGVLFHDSALQGYTWPGTTWADEMNVCYETCHGAGLIARPVGQ